MSCFADATGNGTWAEYMCTTSNFVIPLKKGVDIEQASMLLVNPLSAYAMVKIAKEKGHRSLINTAAASQLGQIMVRLCKDEKLDLVNIVRRQDQADLLKTLGSEYVLDSALPDFKEELQKICKELKIKLAYDAIAGEMTFGLAEALGFGGEVIVYGGLSEKPSMIHPGKLIFEKKKLSGFWLSDWIGHQHVLTLLGIFGKIQKYLGNTYSSTIYKRVGLGEAMEAIRKYKENMTLGKVIVKPELK